MERCPTDEVPTIDVDALAFDARNLPRGHRINDRYRALELLGRGAFGAVYLCEHTTTRQRLAVKLLHERWAADSEIAARARDEARLMSALNHDNVVRIHGLTRIGGRSAVLMEYVEGVDAGTLAQSGEPDRGLPLRVVAQIGEQVAAALDAAWHSLSPTSGEPLRVVHRDIKPPNVLVSAGGAVKVMDFGIARGEVEREAATGSAQFGTGRYMAPERWLYGEAGAESDVFSLGVTLWELVTARPMERLPLERTAFEEHLERRLAVLKGHMGKEGRSFIGLVRDMLAFEPHERCTAAMVVEGLSALADEARGPSLRRFARQEVPRLRDRRLQTLATDPDAESMTGTVYTGLAPQSNDTFAELYLPDETSAEPRVPAAALAELGTEAVEAAAEDGLEPMPTATALPDPTAGSSPWLMGALVLVLGAGPAAWWFGRGEPADPGTSGPVVQPAPAAVELAPVAAEEPPAAETDPAPAPAPETKRTTPREPVRERAAPSTEPDPEPTAAAEVQTLEAPPQPASEGDPITGHEPHVVVIDERPAEVATPEPEPEPVVETTVKVLADPREGSVRLGDRTVRVGDSVTLPVGLYTARFEGPGWQTTCQVELTVSTSKLKFVQKGARCLPQ